MSDWGYIVIEYWVGCLMFVFVCSVDLKGLVDQKDLKVISTQSRISNYVVVQFGDYKPGPNVSSCHVLCMTYLCSPIILFVA